MASTNIPGNLLSVHTVSVTTNNEQEMADLEAKFVEFLGPFCELKWTSLDFLADVNPPDNMPVTGHLMQGGRQAGFNGNPANARKPISSTFGQIEAMMASASSVRGLLDFLNTMFIDVDGADKIVAKYNKNDNDAWWVQFVKVPKDSPAEIEDEQQKTKVKTVQICTEPTLNSCVVTVPLHHCVA